VQGGVLTKSKTGQELIAYGQPEERREKTRSVLPQKIKKKKKKHRGRNWEMGIRESGGVSGAYWGCSKDWENLMGGPKEDKSCAKPSVI